MAQARKGFVELAVCSRQRGKRIYEAGRSVARRDVDERYAFDAERALALGERGHCFLSLFSSGAGSIGAGVSEGLPGIVVGGAPGGRPVGAGADLPGGSFRGPLIPQPATASTAAQAMIAAMERRNIRNSVDDTFMRLRRSLSRRSWLLR